MTPPPRPAARPRDGGTRRPGAAPAVRSPDGLYGSDGSASRWAAREDRAAAQAPGLSPGLLVWIRQGVACALVFVLSGRLPLHLVALLSVLSTPAPWSTQGRAALSSLPLLLVDAFALLCALYLSHQPLRGVRIWRCYPPRRLIPLSLHGFGMVSGLLSLASVSRSG